MPYAENTAVPVAKSRAEIETLLQKYGADAFSSGWIQDQKKAHIQFRAHNRFVKFVLPLPDPEDRKFTRHPQHKHKQRTAEAAARAYDQEVRRLWRSMALVIKAKLEAVESGIVTFEQEFMAHVVMPDGKTFAEHAVPAIATAYERGVMPPLLPEP